MLLALAAPLGTDSLLRFGIGFIFVIAICALVIIGVQWLLSLAKVAIPQPLLIMLGIIVFLILLLWLVRWSGVYTF